MGPFFELFFIFSGPRGLRQKKLQNSDPIQTHSGPNDPRVFRSTKIMVSIEKNASLATKFCAMLWQSDLD
jgi:hypothetical protein